jgi:hypothetical protein
MIINERGLSSDLPEENYGLDMNLDLSAFDSLDNLDTPVIDTATGSAGSTDILGGFGNMVNQMFTQVFQVAPAMFSQWLGTLKVPGSTPAPINVSGTATQGSNVTGSTNSILSSPLVIAGLVVGGYMLMNK